MNTLQQKLGDGNYGIAVSLEAPLLRSAALDDDDLHEDSYDDESSSDSIDATDYRRIDPEHE